VETINIRSVKYAKARSNTSGITHCLFSPMRTSYVHPCVCVQIVKPSEENVYIYMIRNHLTFSFEGIKIHIRMSLSDDMIYCILQKCHNGYGVHSNALLGNSSDPFTFCQMMLFTYTANGKHL